MSINIISINKIQWNQSASIGPICCPIWGGRNSTLSGIAPGGKLEHLGNINMGQHMSQMCWTTCKQTWLPVEV